MVVLTVSNLCFLFSFIHWRPFLVNLSLHSFVFLELFMSGKRLLKLWWMFNWCLTCPHPTCLVQDWLCSPSEAVFRLSTSVLLHTFVDPQYWLCCSIVNAHSCQIKSTACTRQAFFTWLLEIIDKQRKGAERVNPFDMPCSRLITSSIWSCLAQHEYYSSAFLWTLNIDCAVQLKMHAVRSWTP